jgi:Fic family protein
MDMEMFQIDDIRLNVTTEELLKDLQKAARIVNEIRPLSKALIERVQREILSERVFTSNAIEGNTCDLRETTAILKAGHISANLAKRRDAAEVLNLGKAIEAIQSFGFSDTCRIQTFLDVHRTLLRGIHDQWAGCFRNESVMIRGAKHQPPDGQRVSELMEQFFERLSRLDTVDPAVLASWVHWTIARIHPFMDGNGRMARLWQDLILFQRNLTCAIIRPEDRKDYLAALEQADEGDFNPLIQVIVQRVMVALDKYVDAQQQVDDLNGWAENLVDDISNRAVEARRLSYMRWARRMEEVRYEFERCAALVTRISGNIDIQVRSYDIIDESAWELLRSGGSFSKNWFFQMRFFHGAQSLTYFFFFGKHFWSELDRPSDRSEPRVCLLVSESRTGGIAERLAGGRVPYPTLREIVVVDDELIRKRYAPDKDQEVPDYGIAATQIAQDFIQEILLQRLSR